MSCRVWRRSVSGSGTTCRTTRRRATCWHWDVLQGVAEDSTGEGEAGGGSMRIPWNNPFVAMCGCQRGGVGPHWFNRPEGCPRNPVLVPRELTEPAGALPNTLCTHVNPGYCDACAAEAFSLNEDEHDPVSRPAHYTSSPGARDVDGRSNASTSRSACRSASATYQAPLAHRSEGRPDRVAAQGSPVHRVRDRAAGADGRARGSSVTETKANTLSRSCATRPEVPGFPLALAQGENPA
jgi:hypothetical protein